MLTKHQILYIKLLYTPNAFIYLITISTTTTAGHSKKNYFLMDVIFNIMQVEMGYVTFVSAQHDLFTKRVKWVGLG